MKGLLGSVQVVFTFAHVHIVCTYVYEYALYTYVYTHAHDQNLLHARINLFIHTPVPTYLLTDRPTYLATYVTGPAYLATYLHTCGSFPKNGGLSTEPKQYGSYNKHKQDPPIHRNSHIVLMRTKGKPALYQPLNSFKRAPNPPLKDPPLIETTIYV